MNVKKRPQFLFDLAEELLWLKNNAGSEIAERWYYSLQDSIAFLQKHPLVGRERADLTPVGIRSWKISDFPRWLIFYQVKNGRDIVFLRVRTGNMNLGVLKMES
ncbi:MAG TPA: type II toxin-antitoxin system RelE/ParE family toxin [Verrucomicrobiae bacterium]|nr:type II toxin-antitoxin system RelE/ParE family toxin [Verrucomicrobiae bacterium]